MLRVFHFSTVMLHVELFKQHTEQQQQQNQTKTVFHMKKQFPVHSNTRQILSFNFLTSQYFVINIK